MSAVSHRQMDSSAETTLQDWHCQNPGKAMCTCTCNAQASINGQQGMSRGWCAITIGTFNALSQLPRNHLTSSLLFIIVLLLNSTQGFSIDEEKSNTSFLMEQIEVESSNKTMSDVGVRAERALLQRSGKYQSLFVGPPPPTPRFINFTELALRRRHGSLTSISTPPATEDRSTVSIQRKYIIIRKEKKSTDRELALLATSTATMSSASSTTLKMTIDWSRRQKTTPGITTKPSTSTTPRSITEPSTARKPKKILTKVKLVEKGKQFVLWDRSTTSSPTTTTQLSTSITSTTIPSTTVTTNTITTTEASTTPTTTTTQVPSTVNETLLYGQSTVTTTLPPSLRKREDREHGADVPHRTITTEVSSANNTYEQTETMSWIPVESNTDTAPVEYVTVSFEPTIRTLEDPEASTVSFMSISGSLPSLPPQGAFPPFQPPPPLGLEPELRRCEFKVDDICPKMNKVERNELECFGAGIINCDPSVATMCRLFEWDTFVREHLQESAHMEFSSSSTTSTSEPDSGQSAQLFAFHPPTRPLRYFFCKQPLLTKHCLGIAECVPRDTTSSIQPVNEATPTGISLLRSEANPTTDDLELTRLAASHHATQTNPTTITSVTTPTLTSPIAPSDNSSSSNVSKKRQEPKLSQVQVGLIGALIAVGSLMFILVTVLGYFSYRRVHQSYRIKQPVEKESETKQSQSALNWNKLKINPAAVESERKTPHVVTRI